MARPSDLKRYRRGNAILASCVVLFTALLGTGSSVHADSTAFSWTDIPVNEKVIIREASFDQGGYQLIASQGETIVVPFQAGYSASNLYVMKFARSATGSMVFVNAGAYPLLYVPGGDYLDNASVPGSRWYPMPISFQPDEPVYMGIAPTWEAYITMGWYPGMYYHGGYWGHGAFGYGGLFLATPGLVIVIGGERYHGWNDYDSYYHGHPGWSHVSINHADNYRSSANPSLARPPFRGTGGPLLGGVASSRFHARSAFRSQNSTGPHLNHSFGRGSSGGTHTFHGIRTGAIGHTFNFSGTSNTGPRLRGGSSVGSGSAFHGGESFGAGRSARGFATSPGGGHSSAGMQSRRGGMGPGSNRRPGN